MPNLSRECGLHELIHHAVATVRFRPEGEAVSRQVKRILDSLGLRTMQLRHLSLSQPERLEQSLINRQLQVRAYEERDAPLAMALARTTVFGALAAIERSGWTGFRQEKDDDVA